MSDRKTEKNAPVRGSTVIFDRASERGTVNEVLIKVFYSLKEKGYDPVDQLVGYLLSGDPTYVTGHNNARYMISTFERDELIEELVRAYIRQYAGQGTSSGFLI